MHKFQRMSQCLVTTVLGDAREKRFLIHCEVSIRDPHDNGWIKRGAHKHLLNVSFIYHGAFRNDVSKIHWKFGFSERMKNIVLVASLNKKQLKGGRVTLACGLMEYNPTCWRRQNRRHLLILSPPTRSRE